MIRPMRTPAPRLPPPELSTTIVLGAFGGFWVRNCWNFWSVSGQIKPSAKMYSRDLSPKVYPSVLVQDLKVISGWYGHVAAGGAGGGAGGVAFWSAAGMMVINSAINAPAASAAVR